MTDAFDVPSKCALEHAPERAALFLLDATLLTLGEALRCEHPTLDHAFEGAEPPPSLALAALIVRQAERLRVMLRDYEAALDDALHGRLVDATEDGFEIPF